MGTQHTVSRALIPPGEGSGNMGSGLSEGSPGMVLGGSIVSAVGMAVTLSPAAWTTSVQHPGASGHPAGLCPPDPNTGLTYLCTEAAGIPLSLHQHLALSEEMFLLPEVPRVPRWHCHIPLHARRAQCSPWYLTCGQPTALRAQYGEQRTSGPGRHWQTWQGPQRQRSPCARLRPWCSHSWHGSVWHLREETTVGTQHVVCGTQNMAHGTEHMAHSTWPMEHDGQPHLRALR